ncbi:MAG: hydroxysqualene dehydroxylase HpnE [Acidobacteriaceae bacterium]|jgi:zeta-carotene desaturase
MEQDPRMTAPRRIVVVGAGVAGLNAAAALASTGANVTLLDRRPYVGGRAYSYPHPALNEVVDSQHVLVGCCSNLIDFCASAGITDKIRWYDRQTYLEPATPTHPPRASSIAPSPLPAPLNYAPSFLTLSTLTLADKLAVARGLAAFARGPKEPAPSPAARDTESVALWYRRTRQTPRAIRHLWEPLILATLNDSAENCSMKYAARIFYEIFLANSTGGRLGIPTIPLSDFYSAGAGLIRANGGRIELRSSISQLTQQPGHRWLLHTTSETPPLLADDVILALPFEQTQKLIATMQLHPAREDPTQPDQPRADLLAKMARFTHSPFISILLWYDRQITTLDHAWLLDSTIQWFFHKSRIRNYPPDHGSYVELVIAGSRAELALTREQILTPALAELARFFPEARNARLIKSAILKEARATFSVTPGLDASRPAQRTAWPGLYLAGDWTATDWPSTMEGAARSGRLAAGELLGNPTQFLTPDLPPTGLSRLLAHP